MATTTRKKQPAKRRETQRGSRHKPRIMVPYDSELYAKFREVAVYRNVSIASLARTLAAQAMSGGIWVPRGTIHLLPAQQGRRWVQIAYPVEFYRRFQRFAQSKGASVAGMARHLAERVIADQGLTQ